MGNWHISIHGTGAHHNKDNPRDADKMAREFVRALNDAGHDIGYAAFTHGGADYLPAELRCTGETINGQRCTMAAGHGGAHCVVVDAG